VKGSDKKSPKGARKRTSKTRTQEKKVKKWGRGRREGGRGKKKESRPGGGSKKKNRGQKLLVKWVAGLGRKKAARVTETVKHQVLGNNFGGAEGR